MKYVVEVDSDGTIYVPSFVKIVSGIQVTLRLLPRECERVHSFNINGNDLCCVP
jgi:hypothetical protein